jgi:hypothetical protein
MFRTVSALAVAAACLFLATSSFAADNKPKSPQDVAMDKCDSLVKQFKMQNVGHVDRFVLQDARRQLYYGEKMCKTNPAAGIKNVTEALMAINVRPKQ